MPSYHYKAVRLDGEAVEGQIEAQDEADVIRHLQREGLIPLSARRAGGLRDQIFSGRRRQNLNIKEIGAMTRELATLLEAGPVMTCSATPMTHATRWAASISTRCRWP